MKFFGDKAGAESLNKLRETQSDDLKDLLSAAQRYGHAFLSEERNGSYSIWEVSPLQSEQPTRGEARLSPDEFNVELFQSGQILSQPQKGS